MSDTADLMKPPLHDSHTESTIVERTVTQNHFCHKIPLHRCVIDVWSTVQGNFILFVSMGYSLIERIPIMETYTYKENIYKKCRRKFITRFPSVSVPWNEACRELNEVISKPTLTCDKLYYRYIHITRENLRPLSLACLWVQFSSKLPVLLILIESAAVICNRELTRKRTQDSP
jgi:hypothetical protein